MKEIIGKYFVSVEAFQLTFLEGRDYTAFWAEVDDLRFQIPEVKPEK